MAKSLDRLFAELSDLSGPRLRRASRSFDAVPLLTRLLSSCKTLGFEERAGGLAFRLQGHTESATVFSLTCVLQTSSAERRLTIAEQAVAEHLCEGRTLAQIARLRGVSTNTVKSQVRQLFRKLNVDSRVALVRRMCP